MFELAQLDIDLNVRQLCQKPYPGHPKGCPNYGRRPVCPPDAPIITNVLNLQLPVYMIWTFYDLWEHTERMNMRHPNWTWRQKACCLYWQGKARRNLREECREFVAWRKRRDSLNHNMPMLQVYPCPEAMGINVTSTMARLGIELQWPPVHIVYQVAVAGYVRDGVIVDKKSQPVASLISAFAPT